ncbi:hypothetical protein L596_030291 [Steinernema carpocapsae]|uniref:Uncharacterized protein n=1 Tax=Steinernema carpocapsae TaxID=34508 RepID=A0A4U5LNY5_STECR|nr:hypothetical protein L596_030291 [Steinernema carpocapsae]
MAPVKPQEALDPKAVHHVDPLHVPVDAVLSAESFEELPTSPMPPQLQGVTMPDVNAPLLVLAEESTEVASQNVSDSKSSFQHPAAEQSIHSKKLKNTRTVPLTPQDALDPESVHYVDSLNFPVDAGLPAESFEELPEATECPRPQNVNAQHNDVSLPVVAAESTDTIEDVADPEPSFEHAPAEESEGQALNTIETTICLWQLTTVKTCHL